MPKDDDFSDIPRERNEPRPDFSKQPIPRKKLPPSIQETLDDEEKLWEALYEGHSGESTDSNIRYAAYASRIRTILMSAHRYVAYTSDIGESFRPVAHPYLVKGAYGVSWAYLAGDVGYEGYKAYLRNQRTIYGENWEKPITSSDKNAPAQPESQKLGPGITGGEQKQQLQPIGKVSPLEDYRTVMAQRAIFQGVASMGLPAFTIHSAVKYSGRALKNHKNPKVRTWGPIGLGLAIVPFLPYIFDEPVEKAVEWTFHKTIETIYGHDAVAGRPVVGQQELRQAESKAGAKKEKEL
ncbi:mitochondrial 18 KDa protein-domain-containing protein [Macrophomina phaseolina]|uniref:Mitochondrial fission process protein 1 n=1 Tax=Macrophomina phaseolina TaxID=35725 RepID=A0ABQ8GAS5_9PEZI|nr:mitochondrial 18 KDa protein-domain-containing protein [Macrophomina phaseolina]